MDDILIFFRALSQDDQDDIHLKLEDIIQLVSSAMRENSLEIDLKFKVSILFGPPILLPYPR